MHIRSFFLLAAIVAALTVPAVLAAPGGAVASASGGIHWTIPLPNAFGVEVVNQPLAFNARKYADGSVSGRFEYHQIVEGTSFDFNVDVTCMNVYDGDRAKIGGVVKSSSDPTIHRAPSPGSRSSTRRRAQCGPRSIEPGRFRRRGGQRGLLRHPEPAALRAVDARERSGPALAPNDGRPCPSIPTHGNGTRADER